MKVAAINQDARGGLVRLRNGKAVTDSLYLAQLFKRRHDNILKSLAVLAANKAISLLDFKERDFVDERGKPRRFIELNERAALIATPFIGGQLAQQAQATLVDHFLAMRDHLGVEMEWRSARADAASSCSAMMRSLVAARERAGKTTAAYHYANENKLIYRAVFNVPVVDRSALSPAELRLLAAVERVAARLLDLDAPFQERRAAIDAFVLVQRTIALDYCEVV